MKNLLLAGVALTALMTAPALGADVYNDYSGSVKDDPQYAPRGEIVNWSGLYIGVQAGGSFAVLGDEDGSGGASADGFLAGGRIGFDVARGRFLVGAFADYNWSNASLEIANFTLAEKENEWTAGLRAGVIVAPRTLAYGLVGYTQGEFGAPAFTNETETFDGITAGGGIEFAMGGNAFLGMEASHTFYDEGDLGDGVSLDDTRIMGTLKIKLNRDLLGGY